MPKTKAGKRTIVLIWLFMRQERATMKDLVS